MSGIHLRAARAHNLRSIDLDLPHGCWISVVGPSGSGKTSLVFDTLVREGQRRHLGGLSPRARQVLGKLGHADADAITGLPVPLAVGQRAITANPRSTVGTLTGGLDLLRLLYARTAVDPEGVALTRSHFSFNHPVGACPACQGLGVEDRVDPYLLVADETRSIRDGALRPTLKNGYTVYSQVTLQVMDQLCRAHGFDVDTPWHALTHDQRHMVLYGSRRLKVPFGKHSIESRMRWEGITARPRQEGYYRGLVPVIEETLQRNRNDNVLRYVRSVPCSTCGGSRLSRPGRQARLGEATLPALLALPVAALGPALEALPPSPAWEAIAPELRRRLALLQRLGLGHLSLARPSTSLSGGEAQRVRLAATLSTGLGGMLVALDEPTLGLHPERLPGMVEVLDALRRQGNTLLVVEHDPEMVKQADQLVVLGPGGGAEGGRLLSAGPPGSVPLGPPPSPRPQRREAAGVLRLTGARLHNLDGVDLDVQLGCFNVVSGPSGAGKSSLVFGTLLPALKDRRGGPFDALRGVPAGLRVQAVDATPIGRTPRSTPATWTGLFDRVRACYAATDAARARGLKAGAFSYNNKAGRCEQCEGLGWQRIGLHLLADVERRCPACGGARYAPAVLQVRIAGRSIAEVLDLRVAEAVPVFAGAGFADEPLLAGTCRALLDLGLGYLRLGQPSTTLSRGEAQRVKLATLLAAADRSTTRSDPALLLLDEPDRGLHPDDLVRLLSALDRLVDAGHTVLAISHHRHVWAAADHRVALRDGRRVEPAPITAAAVHHRDRTPAAPPAEIELRGVRTHNLAGIDVRLPHRALTVIVGPSGSGKSALAFDTLAAEAGARFAESLPFEVRRHIRRQPRPVLDGAAGLTPTLALRQARRDRVGPRSTVATQSELGPTLRLLWSRAGRRDDQPCGRPASGFSPDQVEGACPACSGLGTVQRCDPARLVTDPERSLLDGALAGTRPGRFFSERDGQYMATLAAVLVAEGLDPALLDQPWCSLPESVQRLALDGAGDREVSVSWRFSRGKRTGEHHFGGTWPGLCALVEKEARVRGRRKDEAAWAAPLSERPCPDCAGERLAPAARAVEVGGLRLPELLAMPLTAARAALAGMAGDHPVVAALRPDLLAGLDALCDLGLGHLSLCRRTDTLSDGELQRLRLAAVLQANLAHTTLVLDEPAAGLDAATARALARRLRQLRDAGATVIVVDHRRELIAAADHIVELGPGAGDDGGRIVAEGPAGEVLAGDGPTATALRAPRRARSPRPAEGTLRISAADLHNLAGFDLALPGSGVVAVTGPSGSGKSSLLFGVIDATVQAGAPVGCRAIEGLERFAAVSSPRSLASTPLDALQLMKPLQDRYAAASELPRRAFSFRSPAGRCPTCKGSGREQIAMDFLADLALPCPTCEGRRYRPEVLAVQVDGMDVAALLDTPVASLRQRLPPGALAAGIDALCRVGLGHLSLGRRSRSLSGGEARRLLLAQALLRGPHPTLHLLDEPDRGLHEGELDGLVDVFDALADQGDLVIITSHRERLVAAADFVVAAGPGGGPEGGRVLRAG